MSDSEYLPGSPFPPDWVAGYVLAALNTGLHVPEIEQLLVSRGLSPTAAASAVEGVIEQRIRRQVLAERRARRWTWANRVLSALVSVVCIVSASQRGGNPLGVASGRRTSASHGLHLVRS